MFFRRKVELGGMKSSFGSRWIFGSKNLVSSQRLRFTSYVLRKNQASPLKQTFKILPCNYADFVQKYRKSFAIRMTLA
jgi:hypothetical protein